MPTKIIGGQSPTPPKGKKTRAKDVQMKPLAKAYLTENPTLAGKEYPIFSGKVTPKGFLLLNCSEFTVLLPAGIEVATTLLDDILPRLHGKKANQLVAVLDADNRFGALIGTTDDKKIYYSFDADEESFMTSEEAITKEKKQPKKLSLDDFGIDTESNGNTPTK